VVDDEARGRPEAVRAEAIVIAATSSPIPSHSWLARKALTR